MEHLQFKETPSEEASVYLDLMEELPEGCQGCFNASFNIATALASSYEDARAVVASIGATCCGWQDRDATPQASLMNEEGPLEFRKTEVISKFCPYDLSPREDDGS